jgi:hypothetical protein
MTQDAIASVGQVFANGHLIGDGFSNSSAYVKNRAPHDGDAASQCDKFPVMSELTAVIERKIAGWPAMPLHS